MLPKHNDEAGQRLQFGYHRSSQSMTMPAIDSA